MGPTFYGITVAFVLLAVGFGVIERLFRANNYRVFRKQYLTDLAYWFFTPLVSKVVTGTVIIAVFAPVLIALGVRLKEEGYHGYGPVITWPIWVQAVLLVVVGDFVGYWSHRMFHGRVLWPFHAVHHSAEEIDWLASTRLHPVNDLVTKLLQAVPFFLLGFSVKTTGGYAVFLTLLAIGLHANVNWTWGPLKYVIASPVFHRWHHTREAEAQNKNFAGLLPLWDILFGTFYMPAGRYPTDFGISDPMPTNFFKQMIWPFTVKRPAPSPATSPRGAGEGWGEGAAD